jgi:nitrate/nitrite transporter NarK
LRPEILFPLFAPATSLSGVGPRFAKLFETLTGGPAAALWTFLIFYVLCALITFAVYTRKGGLLHDIEHGRATPVQPAN